MSQGNTGTWNGPAPRGNLSSTEARAASNGQASTSQPDSVSLPGGTSLPLLGFGTYKVDSADIIKLALDAGYRHIDCAAKYGNEKLVGEGLKGFLSKENGRQKLFITSKVWNDRHRPEEVRKSCEQSIADLGCGHLDLLLMHWPDAWKLGTQEPDTGVSIEETWRAMEALAGEGKVSHLGVSNFSLAQVEKLLEVAKVKPVVNQVELHPLLAQRKLVGTCLRKGVACVAYSPLGHGSTLLFDLSEVKSIANEVKKTPAQVLLKWNIQRGVAVIPRSQSEKNIRGNIDGAFTWELTPEQKARLDALDQGKRTVDTEWHDWGNASIGGASKPSDLL